MSVSLRSRPVAHPRRTVRAGWLADAFVFVVLLLSTGGLLPLLHLERGVDFDHLEGDPTMQIVWLAVYGATLVLLATRLRAVAQLLRGERWLLLLSVLAAVSVFWSVAPDVTFRRTVAIFGTTAFGVYLAARYSVHDLLRLAAWVLGCAAVLSVAFVVFLPAYGIDDDGAWRGIFAHKNSLGRAMALAVLTLLFRMRQHGSANRLITIGLLVLSGVVLAGSRSVAGFLTAVAVATTLPLWPIFRLRSALAISAGLFVMIGLAGAAVYISTTPDLPELAVAALGRDATLTGRTGLWSLAADAITDRVWLGHGYAAFWLGWEGESAKIWAALPWRPPHAHNGFLDLGLELGVIGIVLFVTGFVWATWRATLVIRRTKTVYGLWPIAYLVFILVVNIAESTILVQNSIFWVLYVVTCMWLIRARSDASRMAA